MCEIFTEVHTFFPLPNRLAQLGNLIILAREKYYKIIGSKKPTAHSCHKSAKKILQLMLCGGDGCWKIEGRKNCMTRFDSIKWKIFYERELRNAGENFIRFSESEQF
jgi:hypothetical protein